MSSVVLLLNIGKLIKSETVHLWSPTSPKVTVVYVNRDGDIQCDLPPAIPNSPAILDVTLNNTLSVPVFCDLPSVNHGDMRLNLNEVALRVRKFSSKEIVLDFALMWHQINAVASLKPVPGYFAHSPGPEFGVASVVRVGTLMSQHSQSLTARLGQIAPAEKASRLGCTLGGLSKKPWTGISIELAFQYRGRPFVSEAWFEQRLAESLRLAFGSDLVRFKACGITGHADLRMLMSLMFYPRRLNPSSNKFLNYITDIFGNLKTEDDAVTAAYHLIMTLLFAEWTPNGPVHKLQLIVMDLGYPYCVMCDSAISVVMVPLQMLPGKTSDVEYDQTWTLLIPFEPTGVTYTSPAFVPSVKTHIPHAHKFTHAFGNAHHLLAPDIPHGAFTIKQVDTKLEFKPIASTCMQHELWILDQFSEPLMPLQPHTTPSPALAIKFPQHQLIDGTIKQLYLADGVSESEVESEIRKMQTALQLCVDIVGFDQQVVVRAGEINSSWF